MRKILLSLVLAAAVTGAPAGVLMVQETVSGKGKPVVSRVSIGVKAVRMTVEGAEGGSFIYRADKQLFWSLNDKDKTYVEMTKKDLEKMAGQMDSAMAEMQAELKNLPPEQRAMVEKMMAGKAGGKPEPARRYLKRASAEKVGVWKADRYEWAEAKCKETIWATTSATPVTASDMAVLKDMSAFFGKLAKGKTRGLAFDRESAGVKGVPVKAVISDGKTMTTTELKEIKKSDFPAGTFEVPNGYKKIQP